ncbi:MAG TPA: nucleotide exchange factor GrpE [Firmicutes bacterium]|nr:nucleotide exchange factor GrpE [Candidatus Fermentithermobacillaceae bacterium]
MDNKDRDSAMPGRNRQSEVGPVGEEDCSRPKDGCEEAIKCRGNGDAIQALTLERDEWKSKAEDYWDRYLRARSEMENFRKRTERDIHNRVNRGKSDLILPLLDVMDNFDRFLASGEKGMKDDQNSGFAAFFDGVVLIQRQILDLLAKEGVEPIDDPVGKVFDPNYHEAVFAQDGGGEHGTIVQEVQKGYTYQGQVLRPSRVKVIR